MLVVIYESFGTIVLFAIPMPLVFVTRIRDGYVAIASALWVWIFGVACYYLIPSLGPFDSAPQEFAGLPHTMVTETQARYMDQRAHLLAHPQASDAFAQVSAFASLHVGVTCVIWLMTRYYGLRRLSQVMGVFLFLTIVATVYVGWHFFVDDIAGLAIAFLAVLPGQADDLPARSHAAALTSVEQARLSAARRTRRPAGGRPATRPRSRNHSRPSARPSTGPGRRSSSARVRTDVPPVAWEAWAASAARLAARWARTSTWWVSSARATYAAAKRPAGTRRETPGSHRITAATRCRRPRSTVASSTTGVPASSAASTPTRCTWTWSRWP